MRLLLLLLPAALASQPCDGDGEGEGTSLEDTDQKHPECEDPKTKEMCNGKGTCKCGKCDCNSHSEGKFCQKEKGLSKSDIHRNTCNILTPCILDHVHDHDHDHAHENQHGYAHVHDHGNASVQLKEKWKKECNELKASDLSTIEILSHDPWDPDTRGCSSGNSAMCEIDLNDEGVLSDSSCSLTFCYDDLRMKQLKQITVGIGEQTCGMAVPMQILIGSGVGAGALLLIIGCWLCLVINCKVSCPNLGSNCRDKKEVDQGEH